MFSEIFLTLAIVIGLGAFTGARDHAASQVQPPPPPCIPAGAPAVRLVIGDVSFARADVESVGLVSDYGRPAAQITFSTAGAQTFADLTTAAVDEELPISLNGRVVASPRVMEPILGGEVQLTGVTDDEARALVAAFAPVCP